ncbi:MAG TPA: protein kinase [Gemmataceae bacterium]|nr:protein kinase [Gemmataceae bacterium]
MATALRESTKEFQVLPYPSIPGYELLEEIGRGGMGIVYKARQLKLNRLVALKVLLPDLVHSSEKLTRFRIEAGAIARLQHSNIVQIFEVGETDGQPFIALELVEGGSLADKLGKPWTCEDAVRLVEPLARAMDYAHERGIVHRDLKPANILLSKFEIRNPKSEDCDEISDVSPKITDFGLAKLLDENSDSSHAQWQTQVGVVLGTPPYMAPEQAAGRNQDIGPATDIHALGMVLYEMITGKCPFRGDSVLETLAQVKSQVPLPPSKLNPVIDSKLDAICLRCLQKNPKRRYASAAALADDLANYRVSLRKRVQGSNTTVRNHARRPTVVALQVVLAVISTVGSALTVWQVFRAEKQIRSESLTARERDFGGGDIVKEPLAVRQLEFTPDNSKQGTNKPSSMRSFERGMSLCEKGEIGQGMLWLARSVREAPAQDEQLQHLIRANLAHWRASLDALLFAFPHSGPVEQVGFSSDGKVSFTLCHVRSSASEQHSEVRLWDLASGQPIGKPVVMQGLVAKAALTPDARALVMAGPGSQAQIWDVATGQTMGPPLRHQGQVTSISFSNNSEIVMTGSADHTACLWNIKNGQPMGLPLQHEAAVTTALFSPDGKLAATGCEDGLVRLWDTLTNRSKGFVMKHDGPIRALSFSPNGHILLTGSDDRTARLWDTATGRLISKPMCHSDRVLTVAFSADGMRLATGSVDRTARIWETAIGKQVGAFPHQGAVKSVQFSSDGRVLLTTCSDFTAQLWDTSTGKPIGSSLCRADKVLAAALSPYGKRVFSGHQEGYAKVWEIGSDSQALHRLQHRARISAIRFSPDSQTILTASWDGTARLWKVKTGEPIGWPLEHNGTIQAADFSSDGRMIVTGGGALDKTARLWDARTGQPLGKPLAHPCGLTSIGFSPDGMRIITVGSDHVVRSWSVMNPSGLPDSGPAKKDSQSPAPPVLKAVSPDGRYMLIPAPQENGARLWDVATGKPIGPILKHPSPICAFGFALDGQWMATGDIDGTVQVWKIPAPISDSTDQILTWIEQLTGMKMNSIRTSDAKERLRNMRSITKVHLYENSESIVESSQHAFCRGMRRFNFARVWRQSNCIQSSRR